MYVSGQLISRRFGRRTRGKLTPSNLRQSHGPRELVEETADTNGQVGECHTLRTHLEGQAFDGVEGLQRGQAEGVDGTEDEDESD